jgi:hypothetical protein
MRFRFVTHIEHHPTIVELDGHRFVGIDPLIRAGNSNLTRMPAPALIITD